ncbi:hypothetical protein [Pseudonocardia sp. ICBG1034]|uniref:hypothetical protein n=1 Tax=Pseudonocardia sp. ICBG1034 TaxID=2844381 RepID=UPI00272EB4D1|nr:hypothetical protein [Pseudonocardia sp. ICBG1034]
MMFAPFHERAAAELLRVCRPGGRIGLLAWTPGGFVGGLLATLRPFVPAPPPGSAPLSAGGRGTRPHAARGRGAGPARLAGVRRFAVTDSPAAFRDRWKRYGRS